MDAKSTTLITGATGLVGSLLTLKALHDGCAVRLPVRSAGGRGAGDRVREALMRFGCTPEDWRRWHPRIDICEADITRPGFGLTEERWRSLTLGVTDVFHAAAHTGFRPDEADLCSSVNVQGTREAIRAAESAGAHLHFISSAYIAGRTESRVAEVPLEAAGRSWKNPYEQTKFEAERLVHAAFGRTARPYTVYRPSILTGDTVGGRIRQFNNIYIYMRVFQRLAAAGKTARTIPFAARADASLNINPVDYAVAAIWEIARKSEGVGAIYHIVNPSPPTFEGLKPVFENLFGLRFTIVDRPAPNAPRGGRTSGVAHYQPYLFGEPQFDAANTISVLEDYASAFPVLDEAYFTKILAYAVEKDWGKASETAQGSRRTDTGGLSYPERYFREFLPGKLNRRLIENLKSLAAVIAVHLEDGAAPDWTLTIEAGRLTAVSRNSLRADCTYRVDAKTFEAVCRGTYPPQKAFFDGLADIEGNIEKGLQVVTALAEFFRLYPYHPEAQSE